MTKEIINITEIISYLFCPRKIWLKKIKKIKEPFTKPMLLGSLRHKILDLFNKNEPAIVSSITERLEPPQILELYKKTLSEITNEIFERNKRMVIGYKIDKFDFYQDLLKYLKKEFNLRIQTILKTINLGFLGKELWRNLKPKYLTEFSLESSELGLRGRVDRIKLEEQIIPYEVKTRSGIFESDKLQLAGYALLLENEFGKQINKGIIETLDSSEEIKITQEQKQQILNIAEQIRNIKDAPSLLSNFKKCNSCSLKKQCLEIN